MKILCTICARGGSEGVKNKNIRLLRKKPLIAHSILQAKHSQLFDKIAVSSDSRKIREVSKEWGADLVIERPDAMATSTAPKLPVIQHAVLEAESVYGQPFDYIVDLDATSPLRSVTDIIGSFKQLLEHPTAGNLITGTPARRSPYFNMVEIHATGFVKLVKETATPFTRRQDVPTSYDMNASIYIWRRHSLLNAKKVIDEHTLLYVMPEERSLDIDSLLDWKFVSFLAKQREDLA